MAKEEAIDIIKSECYVFSPLNFVRSTMVNTALDMAVKALGQETSEDCVSRDAVHSLIIPWLNDYLLDETREALETIDYKVEDLPSVIPQPSDCRRCKKWSECPCGKEGHENGNSIGYSVGECREYEQESIIDKIRAEMEVIADGKERD